MKRLAIVAVSLFLVALPVFPADSISGNDALAALSKLAGTWNGNIMTKDGPPATVIYEVTSGGNAVVEKLFVGTPHEMMTVYFVDGGELYATHYCSMGNQPTMKLDAAKSSPGKLVFGFVRVTGLDKPDEDYISHGWISILGGDKLEASWGLKGSTEDKPFFLTKAK